MSLVWVQNTLWGVFSELHHVRSAHTRERVCQGVTRKFSIELMSQNTEPSQQERINLAFADSSGKNDGPDVMECPRPLTAHAEGHQGTLVTELKSQGTEPTVLFGHPLSRKLWAPSVTSGPETGKCFL